MKLHSELKFPEELNMTRFLPSNTHTATQAQPSNANANTEINSAGTGSGAVTEAQTQKSDASQAQAQPQSAPSEAPQQTSAVYDLFAVLMHSGTAMGGHYYAYIKSLADQVYYQPV